MSSAKLTYMGNQIARNFANLPHDEAVAATRDHILKFWNRVMRNRILDQLDRDKQDFDLILVQALEGTRSPGTAAT